MKKILLLLTTVATLILVSFKKPAFVSTQQVYSDSSKPKPAEPQFFILGTSDDFKLLQRIIADPDNVTRNQVKAVLQWIQNKNQIASDTTKKKN